MSDGGTVSPPGDGGVTDAAPCIHTCPFAFDCIAGACQDRAALHFTLVNNPGLSNWRYGYEVSFGSSFVIDPQHWKASTMGSTSIDVWSLTSNSLEPSVFHNPAVATVAYDGMAVPGQALGLFAGPMGETSVLRWVAPATGFYALEVTFTGISTPMSLASVGISINNIVGLQGTSGALNQYMGGNTFTYSPPSQKLQASDTVDFYVYSSFTADDGTGGVEVEAKFTAE